MKIAFFTDTYFPQLNGVTISVANYAKELRKKGHTVYIFAPKIKNYIDREKDVYRLPSIKILSSEPEVRFPVGFSYKGLFSLLRMDFDIVHAHGNGPFSLLGYEVAHAESIPYVMTFHTLHNEYTHYFFDGKVVKPGVVKRALRFVADRCDGVIVPSEKMKQKLTEFGFREEAMVIPNFVDGDKFQNTPSGYLHKRLHLPHNTPLVLTVGRLGREKNFSFLIDMFGELVKTNTQAHLVVVGQGPEKAKLRAQADMLGIGERVHFTGRIASERMPEVYADATVFAFASTTETQGLCVLEAAAAGVPLVVGDDLAFSGVAIPTVNALVSPLKTRVFAKKVEKLLGDEALREKFHTNSQKIITERFQGNVLTDSLLQYYQDMSIKYRPHARILHHIHGAARRGIHGIRKTRKLTMQAFYKLVPAR